MRMILLVVTMLLAGMAMITPARAVTGENLLEWCTTDDEALQQFCNGYVVGVLNGQPYLTSCVPKSKNYKDLVEVVLTYIDIRPEEINREAKVIILQSLEAYYPCPKDIAERQIEDLTLCVPQDERFQNIVETVNQSLTGTDESDRVVKLLMLQALERAFPCQ